MSSQITGNGGAIRGQGALWVGGQADETLPWVLETAGRHRVPGGRRSDTESAKGGVGPPAAWQRGGTPHPPSLTSPVCSPDPGTAKAQAFSPAGSWGPACPLWEHTLSSRQPTHK